MKTNEINYKNILFEFERWLKNNLWYQVDRTKKSYSAYIINDVYSFKMDRHTVGGECLFIVYKSDEPHVIFVDKQVLVEMMLNKEDVFQWMISEYEKEAKKKKEERDRQEEMFAYLRESWNKLCSPM